VEKKERGLPNLAAISSSRLFRVEDAQQKFCAMSKVSRDRDLLNPSCWVMRTIWTGTSKCQNAATFEWGIVSNDPHIKSWPWRDSGHGGAFNYSIKAITATTIDLTDLKQRETPKIALFFSKMTTTSASAALKSALNRSAASNLV